ncbi:39S ribosomal protein L4, mitochondrial [Armadillidium vulgare]|nr:39S ribosomal protein L4, mitochondrial [Armadillidium vulgare]
MIIVSSEEPRECWVESLSTVKGEKVGLISLHADIFGFVPRIDIIFENIEWQKKYKYVEQNHAKLPVEMRGIGKGFGRRPWPQKGTGRARHVLLSLSKEELCTDLGNLQASFTCYATGDLKVVDSLEIPSDEPGYLHQLVEERNWGPSVLFADVNDIMPENITTATDQVLHYNLLPVYGKIWHLPKAPCIGQVNLDYMFLNLAPVESAPYMASQFRKHVSSLNVHDMIKHHTLVVTVAAIERIQERLIGNYNSINHSVKASYFEQK